MKRWFVAAALALATAPSPFDPATGYRIAQYRSPTPALAPAGVKRITPGAAVRLAEGRRALFLDLMPAIGGHRDATGRWRLAEARLTIPGAYWFPEAGRGSPDPAILRGFEAGVARLTDGDRRRTLVVFCLADCWMSWNAARRLAALGYRDVRWLAEGTDGWRDLNRPLADVRPYGETQTLD